MKLLSVNDVADRLGVHHSRVRVLIRQGRLKAQKIGRTWVILEKDLKKLTILPRGRPRRMIKINEDLQRLLHIEMSEFSDKVLKGKISTKEAKLRNKFFNKATRLLNKFVNLHIESKKTGSKELFIKAKEMEKEYEQLLKKEYLK